MTTAQPSITTSAEKATTGTPDALNPSQQPEPGQIRRIFAETWDGENNVWYLSPPYSLDEFLRCFSR